MYIKRCDGKRPCSVTARISIPEARTEGIVVRIRSERRTCREKLGIEARRKDLRNVSVRFVQSKRRHFLYSFQTVNRVLANFQRNCNGYTKSSGGALIH